MYGKVAALFKYAFCHVSADRARPGSGGVDAIHNTADLKLGVLFSERCINACNTCTVFVAVKSERRSVLLNHFVREAKALHGLRRW